VGTIERQYGIDLHARSDMTLRTLLDERGLDSLTQLLQAYHGRLTYHARKRRLFLSLHAEDRPQVQGFRLMAYNPSVDVDFYDGSLREPVNSERASYIRGVIRRAHPASVRNRMPHRQRHCLALPSRLGTAHGS
jgi:hypothetical protein